MDSDPAAIRDAVERWRSRRDELEPLALWGLSALLRGSWSPTLVQRIEAPVLEHATLAIRATAMLESFAGPGASTLNDELVGPIRFQLELRFADGRPSRPGVHAGIAEWGPEGALVATVRGTNNVVPRRPLDGLDGAPAAGTLIGQLRGSFEHEVLGTCVVDAAYRLEIDDYTEEASAIIGTIEGVVSSRDRVPG